MAATASDAMGYGSAISGVISAVGQAYAAKNAAQAEKTNLEFQAYLQQRAAREADYRAAERAHIGSEQMFRLRLQQAQRIGSQRARIAAHGGSLREGSHAHILADTKYISELDAQTLQSNTDKAVWLLKSDAAVKGFSAASTAGKAAQINPYGEALTSVAGNAGAIAKQWYRLTNTGATRAAGFGGRDPNDSAGAEYEE